MPDSNQCRLWTAATNADKSTIRQAGTDHQINMNTKWFALAGTALLVTLGTSTAVAQPQDQGGGRRGNFDPAQMQQRMMEGYKEGLEITDDNEWKAIQPLVQKVMDARMQVMRSGMGFRPFRRDRGDQGQGGQPRRFGGPPSPEEEALQKAVDAKASKAELKAAIAKYQEGRKAKQAELEQAQENLRKVLTARQEALATLNGLL